MSVSKGYVLGAVVFAFIAVAMTGASVRNGFYIDDHFIRALYKGFPGLEHMKRGSLETFAFSKGNPDENRWLRDRGVFPWWAVDGAKLSFFRPAASFTHWLDDSFFPDNPIPPHAQNIAWYALACALVFIAYREICSPPWVSVFAALLYAVNESHGSAVGWIASRNTIMVTAATACVVIGHHRWRSSNRDAWAVAAIAAYGIGLTCGEGAISACAYVFAYALAYEQGPIRSRVLSLAPYALVTAVYLVLYRLNGYGSAGSGWYTDPGSDPVGWLKMLGLNIPVLLFTEWFTWPTVLSSSSSTWNAVYFGLIVLILIGTLLVLSPLLRESREARFWLIASLISLIPVSAVIAQPRVLMISSIGGMALIALFCARWFDAKQAMKLVATVIVLTIVVRAVNTWLRLGYGLYPVLLVVLGALFFWLLRSGEKHPSHRNAGSMSRVFGAALLCVWVLAHVIVAPNTLPNTALAPGAAARKLDAAYATLPNDVTITQKSLILLQTANDFTCFYFSFQRSADGAALPKHTRVLAASLRPMTLERPDLTTLIARTQSGFVATRNASIYRSEQFPQNVGDEVVLNGMRVTIDKVDTKGWPLEATFRFDKPLEDASYLWYTGAFVPERNPRTGRNLNVERYFDVPLPAVGETVQVSELLQRNERYAAAMARSQTRPAAKS